MKKNKNKTANLYASINHKNINLFAMIKILCSDVTLEVLIPETDQKKKKYFNYQSNCIKKKHGD